MSDIKAVVTPSGGTTKLDDDGYKLLLPDIVESPADSINQQVYNAWRKFVLFFI